MKSKNDGLSLAELLAVVVIMGIIAVVSIVIVGNVIDNTRAKTVESDADAYLDALNLYCIDNANSESDICNLDSNLEDIYIASEDEAININTDIQEYISKDFENEYDLGYLYYEDSIDANIIYLNVGNYEVRYSKNSGALLSNVYYQDLDGPFNENIDSNADAITIIGTEDVPAVIENGFSTNASSVTIDYGEIDTGDILYSGDDDDHTFNKIEIKNSVITSVNVINDIDTLIFSGNTTTKDSNSSSSYNHSINTINVKNIITKDNASINGYQGFMYSRRGDWFINNINAQAYNYDYNESTQDGSGVMVYEVVNDVINLETQDNSILNVYFKPTANIVAKASGNSICLIEDYTTGTSFDLTISKISGNAVVALKGFHNDGILTNANNYPCAEHWGWYVFYNPSENTTNSFSSWENNWDEAGQKIKE